MKQDKLKYNLKKANNGKKLKKILKDVFNSDEESSDEESSDEEDSIW